MTQAQQANGRMLDVAPARSPACANRSIGSPIRYRADTVTWAQALLPIRVDSIAMPAIRGG
jgi:hypothetical protein